jgi:hypothetical protein
MPKYDTKKMVQLIKEFEKNGYSALPAGWQSKCPELAGWGLGKPFRELWRSLPYMLRAHARGVVHARKFYTPVMLNGVAGHQATDITLKQQEIILGKLLQEYLLPEPTIPSPESLVKLGVAETDVED